MKNHTLYNFFPHAPPPATVVVGMSGGVDSSLSAAILQEMGYKVIGMFMKNWEEKDASGVCTSEEDHRDVAKVCDALKIPHYTVNFVKEYREFVFNNFLEELKKGRTPNPDILCNKEIKFKLLLNEALKLGADLLATGHYAQNVLQDGRHTLLKGNDPGKDQTYFLYTMQQEVLTKVVFPVGGMPKSQVRELARKWCLSTAEKKDSTGICFIGERNFRKFLHDFLPYQTGNFEHLDGKVVGTHEGAAYFTIGQRRGLGLGGEGEPWFVVGKDMARNVVIVERGTMHPALFTDELIARDASWVGQEPVFPLTCHAKVRYRQEDQECIVEKGADGMLSVRFTLPQRGVTPEQSIVFYNGNICLGGAIIENRGPTYYEMKKALPAQISS